MLKRTQPLQVTAAFLCLAAGLVAARKEAPAGEAWDARAAAAYLDRRAEWWMSWPGAARDHGTFCISCHTAVPYALVRPSLRAALGETTPSADERRLLDNVLKRVRQWKEVAPFYGGENAARSRGTEAVLNAFILAGYDARDGKLGNDTQTALQEMWALQQTEGEGEGAWQWIQFNNEPWEAHDSQYYGAALAAVAIGSAPGDYRSRPEIQDRMRLLRQYLNRQFVKESPLNQAVALWASANWRDLLPPERRQSLIDDLKSRQEMDGGWSVGSLAWTWRDWSFKSLAKLWVRSEATPFHPKSDGYATGLITFALERAGVPWDDSHLQRARNWLVGNQNRKEGLWPAYSPNGRRDHAQGEGLFMNDAATAYAVLALTGH